MESRETRRMVSRQLNYIEIQLRCLQRRRTSLFKGFFYRNRPIVSIDGYDETSTMDCFGKCRDRRI